MKWRDSESRLGTPGAHLENSLGENKEFHLTVSQVSLLEPGNLIAATNIFNPKFVQDQADIMWKHMGEEVESAYGEAYFKVRKKTRGYFL